MPGIVRNMLLAFWEWLYDNEESLRRYVITTHLVREMA